MPNPKILLTGSTGYVGGRLLKRLTVDSRPTRCLTRRPEKLRDLPPGPVEVMSGDLLDPPSLAAAMNGIEAAYYLVHSMEASKGFEQLETASALNFAAAAREQGLKRIIYLGGLAHGDDLSPHLESRHRVGEILRSSGILTIEFQASIIIGAGSLSFEMVKALVTRLPLMTTPKWVSSRSQPIYIGDVIDYLAAALDLKLDQSEVFEIGGPDRVSYLEIMRSLSELMGLKRIIIPVPVLTPRLSSYWLALVTPLQARVGRKLIEGVRNDSIVTDPSALQVFPIRPTGIRQALRKALGQDLGSDEI